MERRTWDGSGAERVLAAERSFVLALGGFAVDVAGASLVTHERVLAPLFNFVVVGAVGPERQAAFFERALDHYFQRALRPRFLVERPAPPHLDAGLRRFGFRPEEEPVTLLEAGRRPPAERVPSPFEVVRLEAGELDRLAPFWVAERERDELARALEVLAFHPNPGERFVPLVATRDGRDVASAILFSDGRVAGIHGVGTRSTDRGQGAATALVAHAARLEFPPEVDRIGLLVRHPRVAGRLARFGFEPVGARTEYVLPAQVELHLPPPGPPNPPRWRPPRTAAGR